MPHKRTPMSRTEAEDTMKGWKTCVYGRRMAQLIWLMLLAALCSTGSPVFLIGLVAIPSFMFLSWAIIQAGEVQQRIREAREVLDK